MTCAEVAEVLDWPYSRARATIANARRWQPGKVFRVIRYRKTTAKGKDLSVYAFQPGKDVPRPEIDKKARRKEAAQRYQRKHRALKSARERSARAAKAGAIAPPNPWLQLAPAELRPFMTVQSRRLHTEAA